MKTTWSKDIQTTLLPNKKMTDKERADAEKKLYVRGFNKFVLEPFFKVILIYIILDINHAIILICILK